MNFLKRFKYPIIIILVFFVFISYIVLKPKKPPRRDTIIAEYGELVQEVSVIGNVKAAQSVELAFENGGKVGKVYVNVGDKVEPEQKLAELNNDELFADLQQAQAQVTSARASLDQYKAALSAEEAKLDEMKSGTRSEEIEIAKTKVANAKSDLENAEVSLEDAKQEANIDLNNLYDDVINILNDAYSKSDNAINKEMSNLFTDAPNSDFTFEPNNSQLEIDTLDSRRAAIIGLASLRAEIDSINISNDELDEALALGKAEVTKVRLFLNLVSDILKGDTSLDSTTLNTYKASLNTARTNVNTTLSAISDQQQLISAQKIDNQDAINTAQFVVDGAEYDLENAKKELDLKLAGYTSEQISAQEAKVLQAKANVSSQQATIGQKEASVRSAQAKIQKNIIYSPIAGVVTKQDAKEGEIVTVEANIISIISEAEFEIETNITEIDISKIKIGNKASVMLDAYSDNEKFEAVVTSIDPGEEIIDGVSTYKTTLQFMDGTDLVKSGMTADLEIMTNRKENVIAIPQRAIITKNGDKIVRILKNGSVVEAEVKTGLRGSDGRVEILEGVKEGDEVITFSE